MLITDKNKICSPTVSAAVDCSETGILFLQNLHVADHFDLEVNKETHLYVWGQKKCFFSAIEEPNIHSIDLDCD